MARINLAQIRMLKEDLPGGTAIALKPYEILPKFPTPLAEHFADSFSQMQLQLGAALNSSRKFPYFRAVLAEKLLCDIETYCIENAVRSDALGTFLSLGLMRIAGKDRFFSELVWKDLTIALHYDETPDDDAPPKPMPRAETLQVNLSNLQESTETLVKAVNSGNEEEKTDQVQS